MEIISSNPVIADYSRSLAVMIAAGSYGYANPNILADNFPMRGEGTQEIETFLVQFWNWDIYSEKAITELDKRGYRPANISELLAFGERYPDLQRQFPIVALGSEWQPRGGGRLYPFLDTDGGVRRLCLDNLGIPYYGGWSDRYRFLAVRK